MSKEIAMTGRAGLVGYGCAEYLVENGYDVYSKPRSSCDLTRPRDRERFIAESPGDTVVHFAAYFPSVDAIENEKSEGADGTAWKMNVEATQALAELCEKYNKHFISASTSYVFDGKYGPYDENVIPSENTVRSYYGKIKHEAEKRIQDSCNEYAIVRFEIPFSAHHPNKPDFARWVIKSYENNSLPNMFTDQLITPVYIDDLSRAIEVIVEQRGSGIFHVGSTNLTSPHQFAINLLQQYYDDPNIMMGSAKYTETNHVGKAPRPVRGGLVMGNILELGYTPRSTEKMVASFCEDTRRK